MPKRVFIIHGWGGYQTEGWFPWLKRELKDRGYHFSGSDGSKELPAAIEDVTS